MRRGWSLGTPANRYPLDAFEQAVASAPDGSVVNLDGAGECFLSTAINQEPDGWSLAVLTHVGPSREQVKHLSREFGWAFLRGDDQLLIQTSGHESAAAAFASLYPDLEAAVETLIEPPFQIELNEPESVEPNGDVRPPILPPPTERQWRRWWASRRPSPYGDPYQLLEDMHSLAASVPLPPVGQAVEATTRAAVIFRIAMESNSPAYAEAVYEPFVSWAHHLMHLQLPEALPPLLRHLELAAASGHGDTVFLLSLAFRVTVLTDFEAAPAFWERYADVQPPVSFVRDLRTVDHEDAVLELAPPSVELPEHLRPSRGRRSTRSNLARGQALLPSPPETGGPPEGPVGSRIDPARSRPLPADVAAYLPGRPATRRDRFPLPAGWQWRSDCDLPDDVAVVDVDRRVFGTSAATRSRWQQRVVQELFLLAEPNRLVSGLFHIRPSDLGTVELTPTR